MAKGKLTIFLGMAPGVGKTYAMLQTAHELHKQGVSVWVAYVETHKRAETEALVLGLPILNSKKMMYQEKCFYELDLEAVLSSKAQLVLIDELAHPNIPGSRHTKRWQDVEAVLEAGIDVFTTLNIQHVESRSEEVRVLAGVPIYETVPDLVLENADTLRLIDLSPSELLQRLQDGKVYLPHKIQQAATHFFKPETLAALRELVLRFAAEKVDHDLQQSASFQTKKSIWNLNERLMVAVSPSPYSKILIRSARRLAFSLGAPWVAVYVNQGDSLEGEDKDQLAKNLDLAKNLGAEVCMTTDSDLMAALYRLAQEKNVTKIVTGRSLYKWWHLFIPSLSQRFVKEFPFLDVYVLKTPLRLHKSSRFFRGLRPSMKGGWLTFLLIALIFFTSLLILPWIGYRAIGFLFLLGILIAGSFASMPVIFGAALLSALVWDVVFIPPEGTFTIQQPEDIAMCVTYFAMASLMGLFSYRLKSKEVLLRQKEIQTFLLYQVATCFSQAQDLSHSVDQLNGVVENALSINVSVMLAREFSAELDSNPPFNEKECTVAQWVFQHHKMAGWSTDTLPFAQRWYLPLMHQETCLGVMAVEPLKKQTWLPDEKGVILAISQQIPAYLKAYEARRWEDSEKLYNLILNCISHELKTPMTSLLGNLALLKAAYKLDCVVEAEESALRLQKIIENLLEISKLNSGHAHLQADWVDLHDILVACKKSLSPVYDLSQLGWDIPDHFPLLWADPILIERVLENVLINAFQYGKPPILMRAFVHEGRVMITISDQGHGVPEDFQETVFEKFFRMPGTRTGGTGLGLAICKEIMTLHQGKIWMQKQAPVGNIMTIDLPHKELA